MYKGILYITYFLILSVLMVAACQKVDNNKIPPIIILKGNNPQKLTLGCAYYELGVDIVDDKPDDAYYYISSDVNPDSSGKYFVEYTAVDSDSNISVATRQVLVEPLTIDDYAGAYKVYDTVKPIGPYTNYQASVSVKNINPPLLEIANFNDYGNNFKVFISPDSLGNISLSYNINDTIINGSGTTFCDKTGFRIEYLLQLTNGMDEYHRTSFKVTGN
jgi:hypothetical protein